MIWTVGDYFTRASIGTVAMLLLSVLAASAQAPNVVGPGSSALGNDGLPLLTDTSEAYNVRDGQRRLVGVYVDRIERRMAPDGRAQFLVISQFRAADDTDVAVDTIMVDAAGLRPVSHQVRASRHAAEVHYVAGAVRGWVEVPGRPRQQIDRPLARPAFPAALFEHMIRLLPLEEGYEAQLALYDMWADAKQMVGIRVIESTAMRYQGREVAAWLVQELRGDRATRLKWVEKATGRLLQTHARPPSAAHPDDGYWRILR